MGAPIVVLAGQSNAGRIADGIIDALNETYGAGTYVLVRAYSSGAPLTSARDGNSGDNALNGAWGNDRIFGMADDDTLQDTKGDDKLVGGTGIDVYHIDNPDDVVIELAGKGYDLINAAVSFRLWADAPEVEDLVLIDTDAIDGIGDGHDNHIVGNDAANFLDGARSRDLLEGRGGADTLIGQSGADTLLGQAGDDVLYGDQVTGA